MRCDKNADAVLFVDSLCFFPTYLQTAGEWRENSYKRLMQNVFQMLSNAVKMFPKTVIS